jgi:hypothetical protein
MTLSLRTHHLLLVINAADIVDDHEMNTELLFSADSFDHTHDDLKFESHTANMDALGDLNSFFVC